MIFVYGHIKWGVGFNFGTFCFYKDYTDLVILIVSHVLILQIDGGLIPAKLFLDMVWQTK